MTLIIYAQCIDGSIIISDRQQSFGNGDSDFAKKIYFHEKKGIVLSLSGDGLRIDTAISILDTSPKINSSNIQKKTP